MARTSPMFAMLARMVAPLPGALTKDAARAIGAGWTPADAAKLAACVRGVGGSVRPLDGDTDGTRGLAPYRADACPGCGTDTDGQGGICPECAGPDVSPFAPLAPLDPEVVS